MVFTISYLLNINVFKKALKTYANKCLIRDATEA